MTSDTSGVPFTSELRPSLDEWSLDLFEILNAWPASHNGRWTVWEPGYLLLEIACTDDGEIEPVVIYTANDELTVCFGYWETHLPEPLGTGDGDARAAAGQAIQLVEDWLAGRLNTAVFTDREGRWCGSRLVEEGDLLPQLLPDWIESFRPTHVEVRTPRRSEWRRFRISNGRVLEIL